MQPTPEVLLLHFTGDDRPGLTSSLTDVLAQHGIAVLDINQSVAHRTLSLGMLIRIPQAEGHTAMLKDLLLTTHHMKLQLQMTPVEDEDYNAWVSREGAPRFILTLLTRQLHASHLHAVSSVIASQGMNIDTITRLSGRPPLKDDGRRAVPASSFPYAASQLTKLAFAPA